MLKERFSDQRLADGLFESGIRFSLAPNVGFLN